MFCPRFEYAHPKASRLFNGGWLYVAASCVALVVALAASPAPGAWADATATASNDLMVASSFPDTPPVPTVASLRSDGFDLATQADVEYSLDGGAWTASGSFSGLEAGSTHSVVARWSLTHAESAAVQVVLPTPGSGGDSGGGVQPGGSGSSASDESGVSPLPTGPASLAMTSDDGGGLPLAVAVAGLALAVALAAVFVRSRHDAGRRVVRRSAGNHGGRRSGVRPHLRASTRSKHRARIGAASARRTRAGLARSGVLAGACFLVLLALSGVPALSLAIGGGTGAVSSDSAAAGDQAAASASASAGESGTTGSDAAGSAAATDKSAASAASQGDSAAAASASSSTVQAQSSDSALASAQDESASELTPQSGSVVATGKFPSCSTATWTVTSDGALTFAGSGTEADYYAPGKTPWYSYRSMVTSVSFTGTATFGCLDNWLADFSSLSSVSIPANSCSTATSMPSMFSGCTSLKSLTLPAGFGASSTVMYCVFSGCTSLKSLTLPAGFGKIAPDMNCVFQNCSSLTSLTLPDGFGTAATVAGSMFAGCTSLTSLTVPAGFGQSATDMSKLFFSCTNLSTLDLSGINSHKATNMIDAFTGCSSLRQVTFGSNWSFSGAAAGSTMYLCQLPDPPAPYSMWRGVGSGTVAKPKGGVYSAHELMLYYPGGTETYVWMPFLTGTITAAGTPVAGSTLTATPSGVPSDTSLNYTWYLASTATSEGGQMQTGTTCTLPEGSEGEYVYVTAVDSDMVYHANYSGTLTSARVAVKAVLAGSVSVSGSHIPGSTLTASPDASVQSDANLSYTWYSAPDQSSAGTLIGTGASFTLTASQDGCYVYATATDASGKYLGTVQSVRTLVTTVLTGALTLSSPCGVGYAMTASSTAQADATLSYSWYLAADAMSPGTLVSTASSYKPALADFGKYLYVTATDSSGKYTGFVSSPRTMVVITGTFASDTAASWTITPDGALTFAGTGTVTNNYGQGGTPWFPYASLIKTSSFTGSVSYLNLDYWFCGLPNLTTVTFPDGFGQDVVSMGGMFGSSTSLTSVTFPAGCGSKVTSTAYMFNGCTALKSVTMPTDFARAGSYMSYMFNGCSSLTSMTLPSGFGFSCNNAEGMFFHCYNMTYLDMSAVSMPSATVMGGMLGLCTGLKEVKLGANWSFKGAGTSVLTTLPDPQSPYSLWRAVGTGTTDMPKGAAYSSADLAAQYTGSLADTYVWAKALAGTVTVQGDAVAGSTLTAVPDGTPSDAALSYTWYESADSTSAGTQVGIEKTYDVQASDVGKYLYAVATDSAGLYAGSISSAHTLVQTPLAGTVTLSCAPMVDTSVTATLNTQQTGVATSFNWYTAADATSDGTLVGGGSAYKPVAADYGKYLYAVATDLSGVYEGSIASARAQVSAVLKVTVPTTMTLSLSSDGTLSGTGANITNTSAVAIYVDSLKTTASAPFLLSSAASFNTASGCNVMRMALTPGSGTALDMADYTAGAQPTAGQWNMAATSGTIPLTLAGKVKNVNEVVTSEDSLHALDISWSFAVGSL